MSISPTKKLPKAIAQMVEKNNLVLAVKTLSAEEGISLAEAKARIDAYEAHLKAQQQQAQTSIAKQQAEHHQQHAPSPLKQLQGQADQHLADIGYKKPLIPYWGKRVLLMALVVAVLIWSGWRLLA